MRVVLLIPIMLHDLRMLQYPGSHGRRYLGSYRIFSIHQHRMAALSCMTGWQSEMSGFRFNCPKNATEATHRQKVFECRGLVSPSRGLLYRVWFFAAFQEIKDLRWECQDCLCSPYTCSGSPRLRLFFEAWPRQSPRV